MKKTMRLAALLLALLLLCACGDTTATDDGEEVLTVPTAEGMTALTLYDGAVTLRLVRGEEEQWQWGDQPDFPLDQTAVAAILALPETIVASDAVTDSDDLSIFGLSDPQKYITATVGGEDSTCYIGTQATDGRWYALLPDGTVRLVPEEVGTLLSSGIYSLAVLPEVPVLTAENIKAVTILNSEEETVTIVTDESGKRMSRGRDVTAQTATLTAELTALAITGCVDYEPASGAAAVCGLDVPAATVAILYTTDVGQEDTFTITVGSDTGDGGYYVTVGDDDTIYRVEETCLAAVLAVAAEGL